MINIIHHKARNFLRFYIYKRNGHMIIDETNIAIIKHLREGRKSYSEIAKSLSITENTVRARVKKLRDEGILTITGLVNPSKITGFCPVFSS